MAKVLVGYATDSGTTRDIAGLITAELVAAGHEAEAVDLAQQPSPVGYDLVIVGSGIHAGIWYAPATDWLTDRRDELSTVPVALFNACLNAARDDLQAVALAYNDAPAQLLAPGAAIASTAFAGRFVPDEVGFFKRLLLRTMKQKPKDHVDPEAIRAWTREVVAAV